MKAILLDVLIQMSLASKSDKSSVLHNKPGHIQYRAQAHIRRLQGMGIVLQLQTTLSGFLDATFDEDGVQSGSSLLW
jgi:hypothetical protein